MSSTHAAPIRCIHCKNCGIPLAENLHPHAVTCSADCGRAWQLTRHRNKNRRWRMRARATEIRLRRERVPPTIDESELLDRLEKRRRAARDHYYRNREKILAKTRAVSIELRAALEFVREMGLYPEGVTHETEKSQ